VEIAMREPSPSVVRRLAAAAFACAVVGESTAWAQEQAEEPVRELERTLDLCRDGRDNDLDGHVDCDDQDCEGFAICSKMPPAEPPKPVLVGFGSVSAEQVAAPPQIDEEGPPPTRNYQFSRARRPSGAFKALRIASHATLWPGLMIFAIASGFAVADGELSCSNSVGVPFCPPVFMVVGGALMVAGFVTGLIYVAKEQRRKDSRISLVLGPALDPGRVSLAATIVL
jgi:hypothetical protein